MVLEKTLESPLACKEIQPVHPKGNQSWNEGACRLWGRTESDTTEVAAARMGSGEGTGNPLQYSCLKNSMDRGA